MAGAAVGMLLETTEIAKEVTWVGEMMEAAKEVLWALETRVAHTGKVGEMTEVAKDVPWALETPMAQTNKGILMGTGRLVVAYMVTPAVEATA